MLTFIMDHPLSIAIPLGVLLTIFYAVRTANETMRHNKQIADEAIRHNILMEYHAFCVDSENELVKRSNRGELGGHQMPTGIIRMWRNRYMGIIQRMEGSGVFLEADIELHEEQCNSKFPEELAFPVPASQIHNQP